MYLLFVVVNTQWLIGVLVNSFVIGFNTRPTVKNDKND
jgi:hypothetical protein